MSAEQALRTVDTLIVDDMQRFRRLVADALASTRTFNIVGEAKDGKQAIERAAELEPDLVILDLSMPRMDGLEALIEIRRQVPGVEIVVLSGFTSERVKALALDHGALAYLEKGQGSNQLVEQLRDLLGARAEASPTKEDHPGKHVHVLGFDSSVEQRLLDAIEEANRGWRLTQANTLARSHATIEDPDAILVAMKNCEGCWSPPIRALSSRFPEAPLIIAVPTIAEGGLEASIEAGVTDIIDPHEDATKIVNRIHWAMLTEKNTHSRTRQLEMLAGTMAHDLRQPLRALQRYATWLQEDLEASNGDRAKTALDGIQRSVDRARRLIDQQVMYAQLQTQQPALSTIDAHEAIQDAIENLGDIDQKGYATIHVGDLPKVHASKEHLTLLFQNLISNAIKYQATGEHPTIKIQGEVTDEHVRIHVQDDGIGINPEHLDEIFQPFTRLHAEQDYPGTGLGLAICKDIVEQWGGRIEPKSTPGEGTTMTIIVPNPSATGPP